MEELHDRLAQLSPTKRTLLRLEQLRARVDAAERAGREPLAVVGMGCRFPGGADGPDRYWKLLRDGVDAITEVPADRWDLADVYDPDPDAPGKMYTRSGGFLGDVALFDPGFFRISPREAISMDPQQRVLLEVAWQAVEDAGIPADGLKGSATGVFIGVTTNDYAQLLMRECGPGRIDGYYFTGNPLNTAAGRVSYTLGLQGPCLAIDTACSSSLVAIHLACQSLRAGECSMALAGGVNLILSAENTVAVCRTRALAADGRCKSFDASADGFVRSEGCGVVVLKRHADALADGDRILALIRGSAVNHDGASGGFTVPNGRAQEAVIRRALGEIAPADVDYVEAHGTGTALGDPIEVKALAAALGEGRPAGRPLRIGSVKSSIGHAESAAGVAGVIKVVLALRHGELPPQLHLRDPSPLVPWSEIPVEVCRDRVAWPRSAKPRLAGVSAFGASGINAHLVLEEAPEAGPPPRSPADRHLHPLTLSARTGPALRELAGRYAGRLGDDAGIEIGDFCHSAATTRAHLRHRLGLVTPSAEDAATRLDAFARGESPRGVFEGEVGTREGPRIAFLFTGQGSQFFGMGRELYRSSPVFRRAIDLCAEASAPRLDRPLPEIMGLVAGSTGRDGLAARLDETAYCQPALFALGHALAELLASWGVRPGAVMGHSVGEFAAACAAGMIDAEAGARLVALRGRLMQDLPGGGGMAAILAPEAEVADAIARSADDLAIAAVNGPRNTVVSGRGEALRALIDRLAATGTDAKPLQVSHAFHSPLVEPMLDEFEASARRLSYRKPALTFVSNLTGAALADATDAHYWRRHCREPVQFARGVEALAGLGFDLLLEIGPRPVLAPLARGCLSSRPSPALASPITLGADWQSVLTALVELHVRGVEIDWRKLDAGAPRRRVALPHYPFQRQRYWFQGGRAVLRNGPTVETPGATVARRERILQSLRVEVAAMLRADVSQVDAHLPFLEMGADSLVLSEAIRLIGDRYGLKLTVRRLFEDLATIDALALHIDENLAPEVLAGPPVAAEPAPPPPAPAATPAGTFVAPAAYPADAGALERVLIEQNRLVAQLLSQQADVLRASLGRPTTPAPAAAPAIATGPPPAAGARQAPPPPWGKPADLRARGLTPTQQGHLEGLIARHNARTGRSKRMVQDSRGVLADSRAAVGFRLSNKELLYPIVGTRSEGSRTWDVDGNEYIDFTMGFGVHLFGHKPGFIQEAVAEELARGVGLGTRSDLVGEVAALVARFSGQDRVAFSNSGTEAVMAAMRLARAATGRDTIAVFTHSYHGHADGTLAAARVVDGRLETVPVAPGVPPGAVSDVLVLEYGEAASLDVLRARAGELAAVMVEPVQSRNPSLQPAEFLRELRAITEEAGSAFIIDEMITGFRVSPGGAQEYFGVRADLVTYGKILGGGLPIGVIAGKARFMDGIDGGAWSYGDGSFPSAERTAFGGTFCQHPLSMAAARAVLRKLIEVGPALHERLNERTTRLAGTLNAFFRGEDVPIRVTSFGSLFRFEFSANLDLFFFHLLEKGFYIWEWRTCFLSTAHGDDDLSALVRAVRETVDELRSGGYLPPRPGRSAVLEDGHPPIGPARAPMSEAQKQLWLLATMERGGSLAYHVNTTVELRGPVDHHAMERAIGRVVARHEALRTTIDPGGEAQVVGPAGPRLVPLVDYSTLGPEDRQVALDRWRRAEAERPFDLIAGPLFRADLIRLEPGRHLLCLTAHHLIADGSTMGLILEDIASHYGPADRNGKPVLQFREYLRACEARASSPEMAEHRRYWLELCRDLPALNLPTDRPRPPLKTYHGGRITRQLDAALADRLRATARAHGCTPYLVLLSGFSLFLHRITGQDTVVTGIPVTGRSHLGSERVVGYCTHILPLRSVYDEHWTVADVLKDRRVALLEALDHQDFPFAEMVRNLGRHDASSSPIVSAVFNLEPLPKPPEIPGVEVRLAGSIVRFTAFDLAVNVIDAGRGMTIDCDFNTDLFDPATIDRLLETYQTLLSGMAADPGAVVSGLNLLPPSQRELLFSTWNATAEPRPADQCLHELFEAQALRTPDRTALIHGGERVRYDDLDERASRLAVEIAGRGGGPGTLCGILAHRTPDLVVGLLAILKAGCAYVPLDPAYPRDRLEFMIRDASIPTLLAHRDLAALLPETRARVVFLDGPREAPGSPPRPAHRAVGPLDPAYVIYTSGSTGRPKGVVIPHRGAVELVRWSRSLYQDDELAGVLASASICFDVSVWDLFVPLAWGGTVILADDALELPRLPAADEVTLISTVPSVMAELLRGGALPSSVTTVNLAGERLDRQLVRRIYREPSVRKVYNLYGPTEDTVYSTGSLVPRDDPRPPTIGRPLPNKVAYVLDRNRMPLPIGVPGELYIGGAGLASGYLNRPDLTAERFVANPFADWHGPRLYRTGDLARHRPDGELECLGRVDHQIKLRGFRIELGEIESTLAGHPWVDDAVVVAREFSPGHPTLVAYLASKGPEAEVVDEARRRARDRLPGHMIPPVFVVMPEFPLLPNGKIDRGRLPAPGGPGEFTPPRDEVEREIATIWRELLGRERVGAFDHFFESGGNSLIAAQVVARIRQQLAVDLEIRAVFANPTLADLAGRVSRGRRSALDPIERCEPGDDYELTPAQVRFWLQDQLGDGGRGEPPALFWLEGRLDPEVFEGAFRSLVERHEILRTVFIETGSGPRQRVLAPDRSGFAIETLDLRDEEDAESAAARARELAVSMDLATGPLLRVKLLRLPGGRHACLCTMHHIVSDGWSARVLMREFARAYDALVDGRPDPLPPPALQFKDFAAWLNRLLRGPKAAAMRDYWRAKLGGDLPSQAFPADSGRAPGGGYRRKEHRFRIPEGAARQLEALNLRSGTTLFMSLLASIKAVLYRHTGQEDQIVGTPVAGRVVAELEGQVGPYLNVVPLRDTVRGDDRFETLLAHVRETTLDAFANQLYPFDRILDDLAVRRIPGRNPIFDVGLTLQNHGSSPPEMHPTCLRMIEDSAPLAEGLNAEALTDFWFLAEERGGPIDLTVVYDGGRFRESTVEQLADDLVAVVSEAGRDPAIRIQALRVGRGPVRPVAGRVTIELGIP